MSSGSKDEKPSKSDVLTEARKQIRDRIAQAEEVQKQALQRRRIEVIGKGVEASKRNDFEGAVQAYKSYLKLLEESKSVPSGGLTPGNFDPKAEVHDLLTISGVYWELLKFYDRTHSEERLAELKIYLGKYVLFSKGMPFHPMAAEIMRKYLQARRAKHIKEFQEAYKQLAISKCFVATELVSVVDQRTIPVLRDFRDRVLKKRTWGRTFIAWYYRKGPKMAEKISHYPQGMRIFMGFTLDVLASVLTLLMKNRT